MDAVLLFLQIALAAVFGVAAVAKSFSPTGVREALSGFGVPGWAVPLLAPALPLSELAVGVTLLPFVHPRAGAFAATALLALFTAAIANNLARGNAIDCRCFGEIRPRPIGPLTLVRNGILLAAAAVVAWRGPGAASTRAADWLAGLPAIDLVLLLSMGVMLAVSLAGGAYVVHLLHAQGRRLDALDQLEGRLINVPPPKGLPVGAFAPSFDLPTVNGERRTLESLLVPKKPLLFFFVHPDCGPCAMLLPKVVEWRAAHEKRLAFALLTTTSDKGARPPEYDLLDTVVEQNRAVSKGYQAMSIPSAVLIRPDGTVGSPMAIGEGAIGNLMDWATAH